MFIAVCELGSLSAAGKMLGISQQAVSSRMHSLELYVGEPVFTRSTRGSGLTPTGTIIASWATDVLSAARRFELGVESVRGTAVRQLDVAASLTISEYLLPGWLVTLRDRQESDGEVATQARLRAANSENVVAAVRNGDAMLGFIETPDVPADIGSAPIGSDNLRVAVAPAHPWARRTTPISAGELAMTPLVMREQGSGTRRALEHAFQLVAAVVGEPVPPRIECSSTAAVRTTIAAGVAPGVLSELAIADDLALGRLMAVDVAGLDLARPLSAVWAGRRAALPLPARQLIQIAARSPRRLAVTA
jgi:DNA-binding transcriptional LysR family regulator